VRNDFNGSVQLGGKHATDEERESWKEDQKDLSNITHPFSGSERNRLFLSSHGGSFLDVSGISGVDSPSDGRVSVWLDMDRDGRQDLAVVNSNRPLVQLYRNQSGDGDQTVGNFVVLRFVGGNDSAGASQQFSNRNGFGTRVVVKTGDRQITREHLCGQGFSGQNSSTMTIGLGEANTIDQLSVTWPSGIRQQFTNLAAGKLIILFERPAANAQPPSVQPSSDPAGMTITDYSRVNAGTSAGNTPGAGTQDDDPRPTLTATQLASGLEPSATEPSIGNSKIVVVTTMASWCAACAKHQPLVKKLSKDFAASGVSFVGFAGDPDDPAEALHGFIERLDIHYPVISDPEKSLRASVDAILNSGDEADVLPSTIVLDGNGNVLATHSGIPTASELRQLLAKLPTDQSE
jgi:peroxiredoxin